MSADSIHLIVTVGIIVLMFSWVPFINRLCPPGFRSTEKNEQKGHDKRPGPSLQSAASPPANAPGPAPVSSLSSRRLADRSRDLLNAISSRDRAEPVVPRIPRTSVETSLSRKEIIKTCAE
jgi:hypothetical protein